MRARAGVMRSPYFGDSTSQLLPIVSEGMSDSGNLICARATCES